MKISVQALKSLIPLICLGLLVLTGCEGKKPIAENPASTSTAVPSAVERETATATDHTAGSQAGGQVVESGPYHLEFVAEPEASGAHLDVYFQTADNHQPIPDAKLTADVQFPDGSFQSFPLEYDANGKHYAAVLNSTATGSYQVAIQAETQGTSVTGRFSFQK